MGESETERDGASGSALSALWIFRERLPRGPAVRLQLLAEESTEQAARAS